MSDPNTLVRTASGRMFDIREQASHYDVYFPDIAEHLAKFAMWSGGTSGTFYSAAQRAVLVHDTLPTDTRAYGLIHNAPLAYSPIFSDEAYRSFAVLGMSETIGEIGHLRHIIIRAVTRRAGLCWPISDETVALVDQTSAIIRCAERRDLFGDAVTSIHPKIKPWGWPKAEEMYLDRLSRYISEE